MAEREKITIQLNHPIEFGEKTITELTLREPLMGDFAAMDGASGQVGAAIRLVAKCAGILPKAASMMHPADFQKCQAFVAPFAQAFLGPPGKEEEGSEEGEALEVPR